MRKKLLLLLAAATWLGGCGEQQVATTSAPALLKPCPGFVETGKPPLVYGAECGSLLVRENPADPASKEIAVEILRLPAITPAPQQDPLFLIQGGPGGSSIEMASFIHSVFADVRKNRDLIFVDQRGTGKSNPLRCEQLSSAEMRLPDAEQMDIYFQRMQQCATKYKDSLPFYTTLHGVQDLDAVRQALGYNKVNLWGVSYGTRVALEYAKHYPQSTRTIILDGVAPKEIALSKFSGRDALKALNAVNAECLAQSECATAFGDILQKAEKVYARLHLAEQSGTPVQLTFAHPVNQQVEQLTLTAKNFSMLIFNALYSRDLTVLLPQAISEAEHENYRLLATLFSMAMDQSQKMNIADAMHFSVLCNEDWHFVSATDVETTAPFFGMNLIKDKATVCHFWPKASLPEDYFTPVISNVPALLLSGKHDPVTPEVWAELAAKDLSNATRLQAAGGNHGVSYEGCLPQIIAQFIERASMQDVKADCVGNIKSLPFMLGANQKKSSSSSLSSAASSVATAEGVTP